MNKEAAAKSLAEFVPPDGRPIDREWAKASSYFSSQAAGKPRCWNCGRRAVRLVSYDGEYEECAREYSDTCYDFSVRRGLLVLNGGASSL